MEIERMKLETMNYYHALVRIEDSWKWRLKATYLNWDEGYSFVLELKTPENGDWKQHISTGMKDTHSC